MTQSRHPSHKISKTALAIAATLALGGAPTHQVLAATCTWNPVAGNWSTAASWSCGFVPGNLDMAAIAVGKTVTITGAQPITSISNAGVVDLSNNSSLGLTGSNTNDGVINMQSVGNLTDLTITGVVSLNSTGSVQMSNNSQNRIHGAGSTLTLGAGQTILGSGQIGVGTSMALVNNGTVSATQSTALVINTTAGVTNNNVLRADGGTLVLQNTVFNQGASGKLDAINGSVVQLSGATITGGSLTTAGGGAIATAAGTTSNLSGVINSGTLNIVNNSFLQLDGNLTNNGTVNMQSVGNFTDIIINGARTIGGTGVINLSNNAQNRLYGAGGTLTLGSGQTLQGAGQIGVGVAGFGFVNQGTVIATQSTPLLINAPAGVTNTGTLRADGGTLQLQSTINSGGGNIEARNGSQVQLLNGAVINNANFSVTGAGSLITTVGGAQVTLGGGTVAGPMTMANNSFVRQTGDLVYNGTLNMASVGNLTDLQIDGLRTISGTATINMSNNAQNRFVVANGLGDKLTLGSGVTLQGAGQLGAGTALAVVNNGAVVATQSTPLLIETSAGITNDGLLRADGGTLQFRNVVVESAGGTIEALNGSQVQLLNGTVINNANFAASGGGLITTVGGATVTLGGGTVSGPMSVVNNSFVRLAADMTYNGVLSMGSVGNFTDIQFDGARTLGGTATISMSNAIQNRLMAATGAGDSATFGSNITVQGAGQIGGGGALAVVNDGSWIANSSAGMVLSTTGSATNNALIRGDGASFTIASTQLNQGGSGVLNAINGGSIVLGNGSQVTGGTFSTASGGQVVVIGGNTGRVAGVNNTGTVNVNNNAFLDLLGTLTNNGTVNLQSVGNFTELRSDGNRSILGTGTITLSNNTQNRIYGVTAGDSLVLGAGQTLQGAGQIGAGTNFNFTNNGTMLGNVSNALTFSSTGTVLNNGLVRADGGNVVVTGDTTFGQAAAGALSAINGGVVTVTGGATLSGGTLATVDTGQFTTVGGQTATLANLANTGTFNVVNNSFLALQGTVTNSGTVNIQSVGNFTDLQISGAVTLAGNGTVNLSNNSQNRVVALAAGTQLTLGAGQTLQGAGQIGAGTGLALINQGTITANHPNALGISMTGSVTNAVGGLMQATTNGTLNINSALANAGTLAANGGVVNANAAFTGTGTALISGAGQLHVGAASTVGTLTHNGSAASGLALGVNNITVSSDYTNANSGTGNAFNRRANVTGTGQILAGGNAAQAIVGTGVTNGATANATLTLGNVRVGATTFNYQVANTGATGPTLRGAIQTNVNGANLTDARLSGAGVTASNYSTGAPGNNSGNLGVTFTVANAGALAGLTGQVLNLRSNFENLADQKLNIVLASGAAAYNAAVGNAVSPVVVANQRVGGTNTAIVSVTNTAAPGAFSEDLNVSVGGTTGGVGSSGSIAGRLAGANSGGGNISVGLNTATAGAKAGTVTLDYQTAGTVNGVSNGLGVAGANAPQIVNVNGNVYLAAQASPAVLTTPINLGNFHVGAGAQAAPGIVINNTNVAPTGFQEGLAAAILSTSGLATGTGFANAVAGGNGTLNVGLSGINAGLNTGTVGVQLRSNGIATTGDTGLGNLDIGGPQTVTINANGYRLAQADTIAPISFGNVLAGTLQTRTVTVSNLATADGFSEALNAAFGIIGGANAASFSTAGAINGLLAGNTNNTTMVVTLDTSVTGTKTATLQILLDSNGNAIGNGLGLTALPTQVINLDGVITGNVGNLASAGLTPTTVNFGKFREGAANQTQQLTVTNLTVGPGEGLNASFGAASGGASNNGGSIASLAPGGSNNTSMSVTLGGLATAGAKTGSQVLNFVSDGSFNNNTPTNLPSQTVNLSADVYRLATASANTPINLAARRVNDAAATGTLTIANTAATDGFSEGLRGSIGAAPSGFGVSGAASTALIAAGGSEARTVSLSTTTAGTFGGNITVGMVSNGAGTSGFGDAALADKVVAVSGKVYTAAVGQLATPVVDFGIVRVGDVVGARNITVNNSAATTALNDTLRADLSGIGGAFSSGNTVNGVAAQGSGQISVALNTSAAGVYSQNGSVSFLSQNPDMVDVSAGPNGGVLVKAQVNNLANADFDLLVGLGLLTQNGTDYILDLGNVALSGTEYTLAVRLDNDVSGPADDLSGLFDLAAVDEFNLTGFGAAVGPLGAGQATGNLGVAFLASALGLHEDIVNFNGFSTNASDPDGIAQQRRLIIRANVIDPNGNPIPEPGTLGLLLIAAVGGLVARRRRARAH